MAGTNPAFTQSTAVSLSASTSPTTGYIGPSVGETVVVSNLTSGYAYCWFDGSAVSVTAGTGYLVLPGMQRAIGVSPYHQYVAVVLSSGTGTVYVERGQGAAR